MAEADYIPYSQNPGTYTVYATGNRNANATRYARAMTIADRDLNSMHQADVADADGTVAQLPWRLGSIPNTLSTNGYFFPKGIFVACNGLRDKKLKLKNAPSNAHDYSGGQGLTDHADYVLNMSLLVPDNASGSLVDAIRYYNSIDEVNYILLEDIKCKIVKSVNINAAEYTIYSTTPGNNEIIKNQYPLDYTKETSNSVEFYDETVTIERIILKQVHSFMLGETTKWEVEKILLRIGINLIEINR